MCPVTHLFGVPQSLYESAVFFDTSAFIELALNNPEAINCKNQIDFYRLPTYTTILVIAETHRRLLYDYRNRVAFSSLSSILSNNSIIIRQGKPEETTAKDIVHQYWDLNLTFCDAFTLAVMFKFGMFKSFTYDLNHFQAFGIITYPPFYL